MPLYNNFIQTILHSCTLSKQWTKHGTFSIFNQHFDKLLKGTSILLKLQDFPYIYFTHCLNISIGSSNSNASNIHSILETSMNHKLNWMSFMFMCKHGKWHLFAAHSGSFKHYRKQQHEQGNRPNVPTCTLSHSSRQHWNNKLLHNKQSTSKRGRHTWHICSCQTLNIPVYTRYQNAHWSRFAKT